jgi:hypothetical protein
LFKLSFVLDDQQFTNINKTKESLSSDDQQFTNINKTKERLNNDDQQVHQYCFVYIGGLVDHHCLNFVLFCVYW